MNSKIDLKRVFFVGVIVIAAVSLNSLSIVVITFVHVPLQFPASPLITLLLLLLLLHMQCILLRTIRGASRGVEDRWRMFFLRCEISPTIQSGSIVMKAMIACDFVRHNAVCHSLSLFQRESSKQFLSVSALF